jgi:hypothetical protein
MATRGRCGRRRAFSATARTGSNASSLPPHSTSYGSPTTPICARGRGWSISPWSSASSPARSPAGRWPTPCAPHGSLMPWHGDRHPQAAGRHLAPHRPRHQGGFNEFGEALRLRTAGRRGALARPAAGPWPSRSSLHLEEELIYRRARPTTRAGEGDRRLHLHRGLPHPRRRQSKLTNPNPIDHENSSDTKRSARLKGSLQPHRPAADPVNISCGRPGHRLYRVISSQFRSRAGGRTHA